MTYTQAGGIVVLLVLGLYFLLTRFAGKEMEDPTEDYWHK